MFRLWFERGLPAGLDAEMGSQALAIDPGTSGDPLATASEADGIIASSRLSYDASVFVRTPRLRVIARTGIGTDRIDIPEATRRGIAVCNAPDAPTASTAEHTMALLLAVTKQLKRAEARLHGGREDHFSAHDALELEGRSLGVVGLGRIGRRVASAARALGMEILAFDPGAVVDPAVAEPVGSLSELLARSDVVTLHLPLTGTTRHVIDRKAIAAMRPGAYLINAARGGLVDHEALREALERGQLAGAGLDATEPEPLPADHPLLRRDDVVVTPHVAAATRAGKRRLYLSAVRQALAVLEGRRPDHLLNPEALSGSLGVAEKGA